MHAIALATGSTVPLLRDVNCTVETIVMTAGDVLFVPVAPQGAVVPVAPIPERADAVRDGCTDDRVVIVGPAPLDHVTGTIMVLGTAALPDIAYYRLEVRPDTQPDYDFYSETPTLVFNGILGSINTDLYDNGLHWIRLVVVNTQGFVVSGATCAIPVIFD